MDNDKQIQKIEKQSLEKLSENSKLAKRGLRDLGIWPKIKTLLEEIETQYFNHNYQKCINLCDEVLATEPFHFPSLYYKAYCLSWVEDYNEALVWVDKVLQLEPDFERMFPYKGNCLVKIEKYNEAMAWFDRALKATPEDTMILQQKAFCFKKLGKINDAVTYFEKFLTKNPKDDIYHGLTNQGSSVYEIVADQYFDVVYENGGTANVLERVNYLYNQKEFDLSLLLLEKLYEKEKNNIDILIWKARILHKQEKYNEAIALFTECLAIEKNYFYVWQFRGDSYCKLGEYQKALDDYLKSIELDPSNGAAYDNAAMCFFNTGEFAKAHEFIDKAISIETGEEMPMIRKAQFFEFQELKKEAIEQYKKTLNKFSNSRYAKKKILELSKY